MNPLSRPASMTNSSNSGFSDHYNTPCKYLKIHKAVKRKLMSMPSWAWRLSTPTSSIRVARSSRTEAALEKSHHHHYHHYLGEVSWLIALKQLSSDQVKLTDLIQLSLGLKKLYQASRHKLSTNLTSIMSNSFYNR